jgi:hypothetical protein
MSHRVRRTRHSGGGERRRISEARARRTGGSSRPSRPSNSGSRTGRSCRSCWTRRTCGPRYPWRTCRAGGPCRSSGASYTRDALRSCSPRSPGRTSGANSTSRSCGAGDTGWSLNQASISPLGPVPYPQVSGVSGDPPITWLIASGGKAGRVGHRAFDGDASPCSTSGTRRAGRTSDSCRPGSSR